MHTRVLHGGFRRASRFDDEKTLVCLGSMCCPCYRFIVVDGHFRSIVMLDGSCFLFWLRGLSGVRENRTAITTGCNTGRCIFMTTSLFLKCDLLSICTFLCCKDSRPLLPVREEEVHCEIREEGTYFRLGTHGWCQRYIISQQLLLPQKRANFRF